MDSSTTPKTVILGTMGHGNAGIQRENRALAAIIPGMLLTVQANDPEVGGLGLRPHNVAGGPAMLTFAKEFDMTGGTLDTPYSIGDIVIAEDVIAGTWVYALLKADEGTVDVGDRLVSDGTGRLVVLDEDSDVSQTVVAIARETVDTADDDLGPNIRCRVETVIPYTLAAPSGVQAVVAGAGIDVDNTDPANPVVSAEA